MGGLSDHGLTIVYRIAQARGQYAVLTTMWVENEESALTALK